MRWGDGDATFVRPVHLLTMLHGAEVVPGRVLDLESGRTTRGHRFMSRGDIELQAPTPGEPTLMAEGRSSRTSAIGARTSKLNWWRRRDDWARVWVSMPTCSKK